MEKMTHTERIRAVLAGQPTDRIPFAAWGPHMNLEDRHAGDFTRALIAYQDYHNFDLLKVMSYSLYVAEAFGQKTVMPKNADEDGYRLAVKAAFESPEDWLKATVHDPHEGAMGRELQVVKNLKAHYGDSLPILPSVYAPFHTLTSTSGLLNWKGLSGFVFSTGAVRDVIVENEAAYFQVMDVLTQQTIDLMNAYAEIGADGFFYCPGGTVYHVESDYPNDGCSMAEYEKYIRAYDEKVLRALEGKTWFNMAHVHGDENLRMDPILTLPNLHAINWDDQFPANPSLAQVRAKTDKVLMGGVDRTRDFSGPDRGKIKATLRMKIDEAVRQAGPKLIVACGCECSRHITPRFSVWEEVLDDIANGR